MDKRFARTQAMLGSKAMEKLKNARVAVFGLGGVGSYAAEALVRTGLGKISLIEYDQVDISNINRQLGALSSTVGKSKIQVIRDRLLDINPDLDIETIEKKYLKENKNEFNFKDYSYIIDAVDTISSKLSLIEASLENGVPIISSMGAGNKLDPTRVRLSKIEDTDVCPLAKVMRRELKKRNIGQINVVWSDEKPKNINLGDKDKRKASPASLIFLPSVFGITMAYKVISDLVEKEE